MDDDIKWITKNGVHIPITNEYMNNKIKNSIAKPKEKQFNEKYEIVEKKDPYEDFNKHGHNISDKDKPVQIKELDVIDKKTKDIVGYVRYHDVVDPSKTYMKDKVNVIMIRVDEKHQRQGIATQLYKQLQQVAGDNDIHLEEVTPEGQKLIRKIGEVKKEVIHKGYKNPKEWWVRIKE